MGVKIFNSFVFGITLLLSAALAVTVPPAVGQDSGQASGQASGQGPGSGPGQGQRGGRGFGGFPGGGRGVLGTVTEVAADHYTIKTDAGEIYTVHFSANTRIMKQGVGRRQGGAGAAPAAAQATTRQRAENVQLRSLSSPQISRSATLLPPAAKWTRPQNLSARFSSLQVDPERAKQMREMQANYGKTWLAGRITAIDGTNITIEGMVDHAPHTIVVDENTSFRQRRDSITLADIKPGEQLRAEGAVKGGAFLATTVTAMEPREGNREQAPGAGGTEPKPQ